MSLDGQFKNLMEEIKVSSKKVRSGVFALSDYYFRMADYFNQMEPSKGTDYDFKEDAKEFIVLAKKELINESG